MISFQCTIPSLGLSRDGPSCDTPGSVSCVSSAHTRYSHRILTDQLTVAACSLLPPVRVFNCRALLPSYLCFSYKTTITHAKYQFHFKRAGSTNNRPHNASQICRQTIAIITMMIMVDIVDVSFILRILSAGDSCRDWSEKVWSRSHEPNV